MLKITNFRYPSEKWEDVKTMLCPINTQIALSTLKNIEARTMHSVLKGNKQHQNDLNNISHAVDTMYKLDIVIRAQESEIERLNKKLKIYESLPISK